MKRTLVLGASPNESRYSNMATKRLLRAGHEVVLIGNRSGEIMGEPIQTNTEKVGEIDTVTLYLGEANQPPYEEFLLDLQPQRVIFNPGTENRRLMRQLQAKGVETVEGCTLVMLSSGTY